MVWKRKVWDTPEMVWKRDKVGQMATENKEKLGLMAS